jgi:hypothetical protein
MDRDEKSEMRHLDATGTDQDQELRDKSNGGTRRRVEV